MDFYRPFLVFHLSQYFRGYLVVHSFLIPESRKASQGSLSLNKLGYVGSLYPLSSPEDTLANGIWRSNSMTKDRKMRVYRTYIRWAITYICIPCGHHWYTASPYEREVNTLRTIAEYTRFDRKSNEEVSQVCQIDDVRKLTRRIWRERSNHVRRIPENNRAKIAL